MCGISYPGREQMSMTIPTRVYSSHNTLPVTVEDTQCLTKFYEKNEEYRDKETEYEGLESLNKKINVYTGDITDLSVDAIVCSVQSLLHSKPYGLHQVVTRRAGVIYEETVRQVGYCKTGQAFITDGFELHAKNIIHSAGPAPDATLTYDERQSCLRQSYLSCLDIVGQIQHIRTVAFPCLGCGGGDLELKDAITTAVTSIREWLETDNNVSKVDSVILVMYNEYQWNVYREELSKIFPYGKDLAGIDMETLKYANEHTMSSLVPQNWQSTNKLCYQYKRPAVKQVSKHFHSIVNQLHKKLEARSKPPERFKNCAKLFLDSGEILMVYHGKNSCTIEIQLSSTILDKSVWNVCSIVQSILDDYLISNFENVTRYKTQIRCRNSNWGDKDGLLSTQKIQRKMSRNSIIQCKHKKSANNVPHTVNIDDITKFWIHQEQGKFHREPSEHNERAEESEESSSWQSLSSIPSLHGNSEHKQDKITMARRLSACIPVEHSDDNSIEINNAQTSNILHCIDSQTAVDKMVSIYQPFNDSLLPSNHQEGSFEKELRKNSFFKHNSNSSLQAWKPGTETQSMKQALPAYSNNCRSFGECECSTVTRQRKTLDKSIEGIDDNTDCRCVQIRNQASSFCDLNSDSQMVACGGSSHEYKSKSNIEYSSEISKLNDQALIKLARLVGNKDTQLGLELGLPYSSIQRIKSQNSNDAVLQAYHILREWKIQQRGKSSLDTLREAMTNCSIDTSSLYLQ